MSKIGGDNDIRILVDAPVVEVAVPLAPTLTPDEAAEASRWSDDAWLVLEEEAE